MVDKPPSTGVINDHRPTPRGVLPRNAQAWLMAGIALLILGIIVFTGNVEPEQRVGEPTTGQATALNPERLKDYQDRLRVLDERARQALAQAPKDSAPVTAAQSVEPHYGGTRAATDPMEAERKRREYESLFASNVVISRRPDGQQLRTGGAVTRSSTSSEPAESPIGATPSIDEVAEAVFRASAKYAPNTSSAPPIPQMTTAAPHPTADPARPTVRPAHTGPISSAGPRHPILEGTIIDTVLTNRLDGSASAPVNCLVTNPVFSHDGRHVLIPAGSRILGETKPVESFGEDRLAVSFNRLVMPDGRTYGLDQFMGLNEIGDAGLRDRVNRHYRSTFGASAAVGLISGLAQFLGTGAFGRGDGDRTLVITGGLGDAASQATAQTMNRFLNRPPNITIREGHRVKVYVTSDFELPVYAPPAPQSRPAMVARREEGRR
jgi:type IV secretion system protein TrbI